MKWNENGACAVDHLNGCPEREWEHGVVMRSIFDGEVVRAGRIVLRSESDLLAYVQSRRDWQERNREAYRSRNLPIPPQWFLWTYEMRKPDGSWERVS